MSSEEAREKLGVAYERQQRRYAEAGIRWNSELSGRLLAVHAKLASDAEALLTGMYSRLGLSYRAHDRILKLSRTIADLEDCDAVRLEHVAEAVQYRALDRQTTGYEPGAIRQMQAAGDGGEPESSSRGDGIAADRKAAVN
ncbi:hypothetical protein [Cohnella ginsengisoli]|uniref:magnesium chelatase subunit ChlI family protein n=1 Tax=Cohnella ginsengisoli TaxID=425004 RepID=UPI0030B89E77